MMMVQYSHGVVVTVQSWCGGDGTVLVMVQYSPGVLVMVQSVVWW